MDKSSLKWNSLFVEICRVKSACVGEGKELELVLDDVFGLWVTVRSCCEKRIETKLCKTRQKFPTVEKVFENKFGQVVEKPSDLILCLFGFMKEAKF